MVTISDSIQASKGCCLQAHVQRSYYWWSYNDRVYLLISLHNYHYCSKFAVACLQHNFKYYKFLLLHTSLNVTAKFVTCLKRPVRPRYSRCSLIAVNVFSCSTYQAYSLICTGKLSKEHRKGMQVYQIVYIGSNLESCNKKTTFFITTLDE